MHCRSYFILVWCLILRVSHLDSSGAVTEGCSGQCTEDGHCADTNLHTFPQISKSCRQHITDLDVSSNQIETLPADALAGLTKLKTMDLSDNIIEEISNGAFRDLAQLNALLLKSNNLSSLQPGVFRGLEGLNDRLMLQRNRLTRIRRGVFGKLELIRILAVDHNLIGSIEADSFKGMLNLGYLYLKDNHIVRLVKGVFSGLDRLKRLDLRNNHIEVIESGAFEGLTDLKELKLSYNRITTVSGIVELRHLSSLNVADNNIKTVDNPSLLDMLHGDLQISIRDNPLDCTCKMEPLRIWYRQNGESTDGARCATPVEYLNMTLVSIKESFPACSATLTGSDKRSSEDEGSTPSHSFVLIIPAAGVLVLCVCIFFLVRCHTSKKQAARKPQNNNSLEQQPQQPDRYEPDAYHTFLTHDDECSSATPMVEPPPPSLNGHAFRLPIDDRNSNLPAVAPEYLSVDDVNDRQSGGDTQAPLPPARFKLPPPGQTRPITRPAAPPRFCSSP